MSVIAGSPTGREPYGDGVPIVVRARENLAHGEGGQEVRSRTCGEVREMRDAKTILGIIHLWRAGCGESRQPGSAGGRRKRSRASRLTTSLPAYPASTVCSA